MIEPKIIALVSSEKRMMAMYVKAESTSSLLCIGTNSGAHFIPISLNSSGTDDISLTAKRILAAFNFK